MGIAKQHWIEQQHQQATTANWICPSCDANNASRFEIPSVDFTSDSAADYWGTEKVEICCTVCSFEASGIVTYSVGGLEFVIHSSDGSLVLIDAPDPRDYDEDWYWTPSDNPTDNFHVTIDGLKKLLGVDAPIEYDDQLLSRIVFSQTITAFEAFLSDSMYNLIKKNLGVQIKIYEKHGDLNKVKFTATEILKDNSHLKNYMLKYFQEKVSFHNFPQVEKLFRISMNQELFPNQSDRETMISAMVLRHDCVHRNGKNKKGEMHSCFTKAYARAIIETTSNLVPWVNNIMKQQNAIFSK